MFFVFAFASWLLGSFTSNKVFFIIYIFIIFIVSGLFTCKSEIIIVLCDLIFIHVKNLDFISRFLILTNQVNMDLVLLNIVYNEVTWIQSNDSSTICFDFKRKQNTGVLLVDKTSDI